MIPQKPFKWVCPECGYSKIVNPKSDVISLQELMSRCPKCGEEMEKKELRPIDTIFSLFQNVRLN